MAIVCSVHRSKGKLQDVSRLVMYSVDGWHGKFSGDGGVLGIISRHGDFPRQSQVAGAIRTGALLVKDGSPSTAKPGGDKDVRFGKRGYLADERNGNAHFL